MVDELDNLIVEDKKKNKSKKALLLVLLLLIVFFGYKVLAPNQKTFALGNIPKVVYTKTQDIKGCGAKPYSKIKIVLNGGDPIFIDADAKGCIIYSAELDRGINKIDFFDQNSEKTNPITIQIEYIIKAPLLEITQPLENNEAKTNSNSVNPNNSTNNYNSNSSSTNLPSSNNNQQSTDQTQPEPQPLIIYPSKVIISYILYSTDSTDPNSAGYGEYIELKNTGDVDKDITGWTVSDSDGNSFTFPSYILNPGSTVRITTNSGRFLFNSTKPVWDRLGEAGYLQDASGKMVDAYSY